MKKRDYPRESKDFHEIKNIQSDMDVVQERWDAIFHNWENPEDCRQKLRPEGCSVCRKLASGELITIGEDVYGTTGKIQTL
jgi:hypothetical protein